MTTRRAVNEEKGTTSRFWLLIVGLLGVGALMFVLLGGDQSAPVAADDDLGVAATNAD